MADQLGITTSGYCKIERDATDISLSRLQSIVHIQMDYLDIFNLYNKHTANAIVQNQQNNYDGKLKDTVDIN